MLKFTVLNEQVLLDPNIIMIDEFKSLYDYGEKIEATMGSRFLLYVFYCCDLTPSNPMKDIDYRVKEAQAMSRAFRNVKKSFPAKERVMVDAAIDAYNFFNETSAERAILAMDKKIDEARTVLEETDIEIIKNIKATDGTISYASNETILGNLSKRIGDLMTLKIQISNSAKKLENSGRVRGGKGSSLIERGNHIRRGGKKKKIDKKEVR